MNRKLSAMVQREKEKVKISVNTKLREVSRSCFNFVFDCGDEAWAELLREYISENMFYTLKKIREEAYEQGYKDAKKKSRKKEYFPGCWD